MKLQPKLGMNLSSFCFLPRAISPRCSGVIWPAIAEIYQKHGDNGRGRQRHACVVAARDAFYQSARAERSGVEASRVVPDFQWRVHATVHSTQLAVDRCSILDRVHPQNGFAVERARIDRPAPPVATTSTAMFPDSWNS